MSSKIFYFSGTGNSLQIARDIASRLADCELVSIPKAEESEVLGADTVGIVFPVYMWGLPLIVAEFLKGLKVKEGAYIFAVATYGGLPGKALDQAENILAARNISLSSGFLVNMPGNYIVMYEARSEKTQVRYFEKAKEKVDYISKIVTTKKQLPLEKSKKIVDRAFASIMYKKIKDLPSMDKDFNVNDACIGCGLCQKLCAVNNITMKNNKPEWKHNCQMCLSCLQHCPKEAINFGSKTINRKRYVNPNV